MPERNRTLAVTTASEPGESLAGLLMRAAARNGLQTPHRILGIAGLGQSSPGSTMVERPDASVELAEVLGLSEAATARLFLGQSFEMLGFHNCGGALVRRRFLETQRRRVAPSTLVDRPWHHAVWQLRTLPVCPISGGSVIEICPRCQTALSFQFHDPCLCDACGFDLRLTPSTPIRTPDPDALEFYTSLLAPSLVQNRRALPPEVCDQNSGTVAELVVLIARILEAIDLRQRKLPPLKSRHHFTFLKPNVVSRAARVVLNFETEFPVLMGRIVQAFRPQGELFPTDDVACLSHLIGDIHDSAGAVDLLKWAMEGYVAEAKDSVAPVPERHADAKGLREMGLSGAMIARLAKHADVRRVHRNHGRIIYDRTQIEEFLLQRGNFISLRDLSRKWGIPEASIRSLLKRGVMSEAECAARCLHEPRHMFHRDEVRRIEVELARVSRSVRATTPALDLPGPRRQFADVIEAAISGAVRITMQHAGKLAERIAVANDDVPVLTGTH